MEKTVLVGLSGGVDSAAVAYLLQKQGYRVHGVYLALCGDADPSHAAEVARKLGIEFSVVDHRRKFKNRVIRPFVETYRTGRTPNPCVECNRHLKIESLIREADRLGAEQVATGHYARVVTTPEGRVKLLRGKDRNKDQSYFLWKLTQRQLKRLLLPLGGMEKDKVRAIGADFVAKKEKESMEICFIPDGDTQRFVEMGGGKTAAGPIVDETGAVLGEHQGIYRYTIGQRRGLGVSAGKRMFVTALHPDENRVVLGREEALLTDRIRVSELHFCSAAKSRVPEQVGFKGRNRGEPIPCRLAFDQEGVTVYPQAPIRRFAAGQSACFYDGDVLLFGGVIQDEA